MDHNEEAAEGDSLRLGKSKENSPSLLTLPIEILQTITWHLDASAFFTSILICKRFMDAALSRRNIFHHILSLPGIRLGLNDLETSELLLAFRQRAAKNLCGASVFADVTRYDPVPSTISFSKAVFSPGSPAQLATAQDFATVHVYELTSKNVRLKAELQSHCCSWEAVASTDLDIIKIAFSSSRDLAVLYKPRRPAKKQKLSPFVDELAKPDTQVLKLVTFHRLYASTKGYFYSSHQQETRDIICDIQIEPVGLAIASNGNACIAYKTPVVKDSTEMLLIGRNAKVMDACSYGQFQPLLVCLMKLPIVYSSLFSLTLRCELEDIYASSDCKRRVKSKFISSCSDLPSPDFSILTFWA